MFAALFSISHHIVIGAESKQTFCHKRKEANSATWGQWQKTLTLAVVGLRKRGAIMVSYQKVQRFVH